MARAAAENPEFDPIEHYLTTGWREGRDPSRDFSTRFYLGEYPDVAASGDNPFLHYVQVGRAEGRRGKASPEPPAEQDSFAHARALIAKDFDVAFYLNAYPDIAIAVAEQGLDPIEHYLAAGWRNQRDPNPEFSTADYLSLYPDVAESGENPFVHYVTRGRAEGRLGRKPIVASPPAPTGPSPRDIIATEFDVAFYLSTNPDLAAAVARERLDPVQHYLNNGWREGRNPHPSFSTAYYLASNPDVAASGQNPYLHFITSGRQEGRLGAPQQPAGETQAEPAAAPRSALDEEKQRWAADRSRLARAFDAAYYLASNPDLAEQVRSTEFDPILHYLQTGWREGRDPHPDFSTNYYLSRNPDVAASGQNPFLHFVIHGKSQGRLGRRPGGFRGEYLSQLRSHRELAEHWTIPRRPQVIKGAAKLVGLIARHMRADRRLVVSISHDDYLKHTGGVQLCIRREADAFASNGDCYLNIHPVQPLPALADDGANVQLRLICNGRHIGISTAAEIASALRDLTALTSDRLFIIHALQGHSPEAVATIAQTLGSGSHFYWVHDFLAICQGYTLLRNGIIFCGVPSPSSPACHVCVHGDGREQHLQRVAMLFDAVPFRVVAPSQPALDLWRKHARVRVASATVHPHCSFRDLPRPPKVRTVRKPRLGYLGAPSLHKGWPLFEELVQRHAEQLDFYCFGEVAPRDARVKWIEVRASKDPRAHAMTAAVAEAQVDHALIWSLCPETFCLTAFEAIAGGASIITSRDSGNVPSVVAETGYGRVLDDEAALHAYVAELAEASPLAAAWRGATSELRHSLLTFDLAAESPARAATQ